ncbi:conserved hypothetical protein [Chlorobium limicola DSM 245]|uniref:CRISPR type III-B/RAMP module-associated protein Cmr5 n=1 Tax=Chlorobium limicola (strain DSM 245 / NBRC 103803 / 6330) TaxID=290315 RepID=B3EIS2_CHLL2|nr:hypothetical protein [Chlorobium limicola]ACD90013.1 conserved hypothetical protein [Chlorobium limicola DSM 245]NTW64068.1 hypothetical protein [Chlorobiaceae bacterium]
MTQLNLDQLAARYAQKIVEKGKADIENPVTKALGVLQEQGVYACILYLLANKHDNILKPLYQLVGELPGFRGNEKMPDEKIDSKEMLKFYGDCVCSDLDTLLLVKELYEQTLIYARYGAKAAGK